jgi:hypothetical protein
VELKAMEAAQRALKRGTITKPTACQKCDTEVARPALLSAYHVDVTRPLEVTWLCRRCYYSLRPPSVPKEVLRPTGCPPYEQMKIDYFNGLSYEQMAEKYGVNGRATVWITMRKRARAVGEWPLPKPRNTVQINVVWDLVKSVMVVRHAEAIERRLTTEPVVVSMSAAASFAPRCQTKAWPAVRRPIWFERWPEERPIYHLAGCNRLGLVTSTFELSRDEAEDWGYVPCQVCAGPWVIEHFGNAIGVQPDTLKEIDRGETTEVPFTTARKLLAAIGERIPATLYTGAELIARKEQRAIYQDYLQHQARASAAAPQLPPSSAA